MHFEVLPSFQQPPWMNTMTGRSVSGTSVLAAVVCGVHTFRCLVCECVRVCANVCECVCKCFVFFQRERVINSFEVVGLWTQVVGKTIERQTKRCNLCECVMMTPCKGTVVEPRENVHIVPEALISHRAQSATQKG
jgi:hypothetical protein